MLLIQPWTACTLKSMLPHSKTVHWAAASSSSANVNWQLQGPLVIRSPPSIVEYCPAEGHTDAQQSAHSH